MKIAITSNGKVPGATISKTFARCFFFAVFDTETEQAEFINNPYRLQPENAGEDVAIFLAAQKVKRIISCDFGTKAMKILEEHHIQLVVFANESSTIGEIITMFKSITH